MDHTLQTATSPFYKAVKRQASHAASSLLQVETGRGARRAMRRVLESDRRVDWQRMVEMNPGPEGSRRLLQINRTVIPETGLDRAGT
jgi:hypothetical protein